MKMSALISGFMLVWYVIINFLGAYVLTVWVLTLIFGGNLNISYHINWSSWSRLMDAIKNYIK